MEATQVQLRLTKNPEILTALRQRGRLKPIRFPDGRKLEVYTIQHDSFTFDFTPSAEITVGKNVARALRQSSRFILGEHLTGAFTALSRRPVIEQVNLSHGSLESGSECGRILARNMPRTGQKKRGGPDGIRPSMPSS